MGVEKSMSEKSYYMEELQTVNRNPNFIRKPEYKEVEDSVFSSD